MNDILSWLVPLLCLILAGSVAWLIKLAVDMNSLKKDNEYQDKVIEGLQKSMDEHKAQNQMQHEELYTSRNQVDVSLGKLETLVVGLDKKLDQLLDRRKEERG